MFETFYKKYSSESSFYYLLSVVSNGMFEFVYFYIIKGFNQFSVRCLRWKFATHAFSETFICFNIPPPEPRGSNLNSAAF